MGKVVGDLQIITGVVIQHVDDAGGIGILQEFDCRQQHRQQQQQRKNRYDQSGKSLVNSGLHSRRALVKLESAGPFIGRVEGQVAYRHWRIGGAAIRTDLQQIGGFYERGDDVFGQ